MNESKNGMGLIFKATVIAEKVHANQVDKKNYPYMAHVQDVASRVSHFGEAFEIVALLHDAIEDAEPKEFQEKILDEIEICFDDSIVQAIIAMTKNSGENYYEDYLPRLKENKIATQVKIADSSHNLSKAHLIDDAQLQTKLRTKYVNVLNQLGVDGKRSEKPIIFKDGCWIEK